MLNSCRFSVRGWVGWLIAGWFGGVLAAGCQPVAEVARPGPSPPHATSTSANDALRRLFDAATTRIRDIQGAGHRSPLVGQQVIGVPGIVTSRRGNGFTVQDPFADDDLATSEGLLIFTGQAPPAQVGDLVRVTGTVKEFYGRGEDTAGLSNTELVDPQVEVVSGGHPLPPPVVVGRGGRIPPDKVFSQATGDVEKSHQFDPETAGLDFYESLEFMRVQINNAVVVGPTNRFGEVVVLGDNGERASLRTPRGGLVVRPDDFNPERIFVAPGDAAVPRLSVGDRFTGPLIGVVDYSFGNYKVRLAESAPTASAGLPRDVATPAAADTLSLATFNVENFHAGEPESRARALARQIVNNLAAPDLVGLQEVSDNNGPQDNDVADADETLDKLVRAIRAVGGPRYEYAQINPRDDQDGGRPGDNIRVAFLYRTDRGLELVRRGQAGPDDATRPEVGEGDSVRLSLSPGRVDPQNRAFDGTRKSLAGEFRWQGRTLFVVVNHLSSKMGDEPLFGRWQPPRRPSEQARAAQARVLNLFVRQLLQHDAGAAIVVLGDLNDFAFSESVQTLAGDELEMVTERLPDAERYTYVYEGNSQQLDHLLVSHALSPVVEAVQIIHANAEYADQTTDHDPIVVRLRWSD